MDQFGGFPLPFLPHSQAGYAYPGEEVFGSWFLSAALGAETDAACQAQLRPPGLQDLLYHR